MPGTNKGWMRLSTKSGKLHSHGSNAKSIMLRLAGFKPATKRLRVPHPTTKPRNKQPIHTPHKQHLIKLKQTKHPSPRQSAQHLHTTQLLTG